MARNNINGRFERKYKLLNENLFNVLTNEVSWLLGILASDGCIKGNVVSISQSGDIGLQRIKKIKKLYGCENPIYEYKPSKGNSVFTLSVSSSTMVNELSKYNIVPNKTHTFEFPDSIPEDRIPSFIEGYIEGDGTIGIYTNNKGYSYLTTLIVGTESFIKALNKKLPIKGNINKIKRSTIYELRWNGKNSIKINNFIYTNPVFPQSPKLSKHIHYINTYSPDFIKYDRKLEEAKVLLKEGHSIIEIAKILGMHFQLLYKWKRSGKLLID